MRVLVTGSRTWDHGQSIWDCLDAILTQAEAIREGVVLVHGANPKGADAHADEWGRARIHDGRPVRVDRHPANWVFNGRGAGIQRNAHMVALGADVCLAFIRDNSRGATHCAEAAERAGIPVVLIDYPGPGRYVHVRDEVA